MNELSKALEEYIASEVEKDLAETNVKMILLVSALETLMQFLYDKKVIDKNELRAVLDEALEQKTAELHKTLGKTSEVRD